MALTPEQLSNNLRLDFEIKLAQREHQRYIDGLAMEKEIFIAKNPDFPKDRLDLMFIPVCSPRQVGGIRYIDEDEK